MSKSNFLRMNTDHIPILTMVFNNQEGLPLTSCVFNWQMSTVIRTQTKTTQSKPCKRTFKMNTRICPKRSLSETRSIPVRLSSTNLAISTRTTITLIVMTITTTLIDLVITMFTQRLNWESQAMRWAWTSASSSTGNSSRVLTLQNNHQRMIAIGPSHLQLKMNKSWWLIVPALRFKEDYQLSKVMP